MQLPTFIREFGRLDAHGAPTRSSAPTIRSVIAGAVAGSLLFLAGSKPPPARAADIFEGRAPYEEMFGTKRMQVDDPPTTSIWKPPPYNEARKASDLRIAEIFGGEGAVAAANGYEPMGLPGYKSELHRWRGALPGGPPGHLETHMHLYGSSDGKGVTPIYLPEGFVYLGAMTTAAGKAEGGHSFYFRKLGKLRNVTMHVFHVDDFEIKRNVRNDAGSIRIGNVGGPGGRPVPGARPADLERPYIHAHFTLHKGRGFNRSRVIPFASAF